MIRWACIVSWHVVKADDGTHTLCGRSLDRTQAGNLRDELPAEKSCETCLRMVARRAAG